VTVVVVVHVLHHKSAPDALSLGLALFPGFTRKEFRHRGGFFF
jgi:hypothetical protein